MERPLLLQSLIVIHLLLLHAVQLMQLAILGPSVSIGLCMCVQPAQMIAFASEHPPSLLALCQTPALLPFSDGGLAPFIFLTA